MTRPVRSRHFDYDHNQFTDQAYWTEQGSDPATPASGDWVLYFKAAGAYIEDDTGAVTLLGSGGGSTVWRPVMVADSDGTHWNVLVDGDGNAIMTS